MSSTPSSNVITITDKSGTLTGMTNTGTPVVTSGQDHSASPTISRSGAVFTITFNADRKASTSVAQSYNSLCGGAAYEYAASFGGGTPQELNFYFSLSLTFTTAQGPGTATLVLAQGNHNLTNNWWIGGSIVTSSVPSLDVPIASNQYTLQLPVSGDNDSYTLGLGSVEPNSTAS